MDLILNGESRSFDASDCANLAELVARAERLDSGGSPCVVTAIEIDGEPLPPEELGSLELHAIEHARRIAIVRQPRREVALRVLEQGASYCERIVAAIAQCAGDYRSNRTQQASRVLADILDSLSVLTGITVSVSAELSDAASELAALQGEIQPWLEQMLEAQSGNDPIRIADLLEYEIAPRIEAWGVAMQGFASGSAPLAASR
ncbi:hypothetical protein K2X89_01135 [Myxococcota bacterium]|nr:hypothetical protein [Myxococcota bacterium]